MWDLKSQEPPQDAKVYIITPAEGSEVGKTFSVKFGVEGIMVKPAGDQTPHSGHFALMVNVDKAHHADMPISTSLHPGPDVEIPAGPQTYSFGKAQTDTTITLSPGQHTLQLIFVDQYHVPFKPSLESDRITVHIA
ncbi:DUF4399 domain-containing protein [Streptomyces sp. NPDC127051]|uniref:DUF4399 domain-containing protein n=1 Tax=Streptomyces sp. NPDC127051 TaxID=3347119 RepID=UPI00364F3595